MQTDNNYFRNILMFRREHRKSTNAYYVLANKKVDQGFVLADADPVAVLHDLPDQRADWRSSVRAGED
jgi:hypothetical protein